MSECVYYKYKEGDYHCSKTNHDISDVTHVRKYCWGNCGDCPIYKGNQAADHHRGTDECIYYCFENDDYYCQKACKHIDKSMVDSCCRNHNYAHCAIYTDFESSSLSGQPGESSAPIEYGRTKTIFEGENLSSSFGTTDAKSGATNSTVNPDDYSVASVIFSILVSIFFAVWKFIKTIPFWGPYCSILVLPFLMIIGPSGGSSSGGSVSVAGVFFFVYLILHTILLFKCKKWTAKHKYWPIYVGFILLVTTLVAMWAVPAVAFQIGALIYMKQQRNQLPDDAKFCSACGTSVKTTTESDNTILTATIPQKSFSKKKKLLVFVVLPLIAIVLCSIFRLVQYSGYKSFVNKYFEAIETNDMDEITQFYSWDYVEEKNQQNQNDPYAQFFYWNNLEYYIESMDKYRRWFAGEEIESIKIKGTEKSLLSSTTKMEVEVYVVFEHRSDDVIVFIEIEKGRDGWFIIWTDAYYASDEVED